jgi:hypothetical protein
MPHLGGQLPAFHGAGTKAVAGQPARVLHGRDGSRLVVAETGPAFPLQAVSPHHRGGQLHFSQWDHVPPPAAPPPGQVISLGQLGTA